MQHPETLAQTHWRLRWAENKTTDLIKSLAHILETGSLTDEERGHLEEARQTADKVLSEVRTVRNSVQKRK